MTEIAVTSESVMTDRDTPGNNPATLEIHADGDNGKNVVVASELLPLTLPILPLSHRPFFPVQAMPLVLDEGPWLETVKTVGESEHKIIGLVLTEPGEEEPPPIERFKSFGTVARMRSATRDNGKIQIVLEGMQRFRIQSWLGEQTPYVARVQYLGEEHHIDNDETRAFGMAMLSTLKELIPLNPLYNEELKLYLERFSPNQPSFLTYFAANLTTASGPELQAVLEAPDLSARMRQVLELLGRELEIAKLQSEIRSQVEQKMGQQQREFFLREQLKAIQKELGLEKDDRTADIEQFRARLDDISPSDQALERIERELTKLSVLETGSPEYGVTRGYLEWITGLPWGLHSQDQLDLEEARKRLDSDHTGLDEVKERIVEFLAVGKLRGQMSGSILLLVGPPGVGKTSIGRSVATALGREFFRFSVGGMRDEAEIKGHRRTYIGAMPGKFIQALSDVGVSNPVIMLDEIDKVGASYHGDPASALLEALDPEQNSEFLDHYLDQRFDLSQVLFVCTANQLDTIPPPLLDRMEVIRLSGYLTQEKVAIARKHLWPRQLERAGLKAGEMRITDAVLRTVVEDYAREAGVRGLDKQLGRIVRKAAVGFANGDSTQVRVTRDKLLVFLGPPLFRAESPQRGIGIVTGLAWTAMGGATLSVESSLVHGKNRGFKLTGQLGDVMRESAEIAYSYVASNLTEFGADPQFFDEAFVHLHVPEGATPKDGPSAGITMATALISLARSAQPRRQFAMTGELTLTGRVLPVGGIREKVLAARRARIGELVLPAANRRDFDELPEHLRDGLTVHFAENYRDVYAAVF